MAEFEKFFLKKEGYMQYIGWEWRRGPFCIRYKNLKPDHALGIWELTLEYDGREIPIKKEKHNFLSFPNNPDDIDPMKLAFKIIEALA